MEPVETAARSGGADLAKKKTAPAKAPDERGFLKRSLEWFWGAEPGVELESASARAFEYERRARVAAELARRALEPPRPFADGSADGLSAGLYHQSIAWGLRSLAERNRVAVRSGNGHAKATPSQAAIDVETPSSDASAKASDSQDGDFEGQADSEPSSSAAASTAPSSSAVAFGHAVGDLATLGVSELWQAADPEQLLLQANLTRAEIDEAKQQMSGCSFADYTDLPADDQLRWARKLRVVAEGLLYGIEVSSSRYSPPWLRRALTVGLLLVLIVGVGWGALSVRKWRIELDNIARGKPWTTSSEFAVTSCRSPAQKCPESPNFFFHTKEESRPWVKLDLGSVQRFSFVRVKNREDCCFERAFPLMIDVSSDGKRWKQLARRNEEFRTWTAEFEPVEGRWVRLRLARKGILHLASVDIYK